MRKGLTTLIVLDALAQGELYGYGLRREVQERTKGLFSFTEGALYPLLHSLAARRLVTAHWRVVSGRKRAYYAITRKGRQAHIDFCNEWAILQRALAAMLRNQDAPARGR